MQDLDYYSAAVCRRGHVEAESIEYRDQPIPPRCPTCGAELLTQCPSCEQRIRGAPSGFYGQYAPPDFCDRCAKPFPWLSRQGRIYLLQDMLDRADVPEAERLRAREQLDNLTNPELDEQEQADRWTRFKRAAPNVWSSDAAQSVIATLVEAGVRALIR